MTTESAKRRAHNVRQAPEPDAPITPTDAAQPKEVAGEKGTEINRYPWYAPRFWHGMRMRSYAALMARNRFQIHFLGLGPALAIAGMSGFNSLMYRLQELVYGRRIREQALAEPPIFIIGHWRSGTTLLHELMVRDARFSSPTTYQCFAPHHFLVTGGFVPWMCQWLLPRRRPMDNMEAGFDRPQEDEFALCVMDAPTPYLRMAFPNRPAPYEEFLDMEGVDSDDLARFQHALTWFFQALTYHHQKRLVLKSPPHTGRIEFLSKRFPGAKFIHLSRHPYEVYASTLKLWRTLDRNQGFQIPRYSDAELSEYVLRTFERMYSGYRKQRELIPAEHLIEVKYEELVQNPARTVETIYDELHLNAFDAMRPQLDRFLETQRGYRPTKYSLAKHETEQINQRWAWYFKEYGYQPRGLQD